MARKAKAKRPVLNDVIVYFAFEIPNLSEAKLNKIIFLADLYHYANRGHRITSVPFRNYLHGPWSSIIAQTAQESDGRDIRIEIVHSQRKGDMMIIRPNVPQTTIDLPKEAIHTVKEVAHQWGQLSLTEVIEFAKRTPLFVSTPFGEVIDFERVPPSPDLLKTCSATAAKRISESLRQHNPLILKALQAWPAHA